MESAAFEWGVGTSAKESCNHICKRRELTCDHGIYSGFSCEDAAIVICNNPFMHPEVDYRPACTVGGGCFINCGEWVWASVARWNGTCGPNDCTFGEDLSLRIVCPCSSEAAVENDDILQVETTSREYLGLCILVFTFSMILVWLMYCSCSLQIFTW